MAFYQLPKIIGKDKKPPFGARINWHHPLSQGLVGAWLLNEGGGTSAYDIFNRMNGSITRATSGNFPTWDGSFEYPGVNLAVTDYGYITVPHDPIQNPSSMTIYSRFIILTSFDDTRDILNKGQTTGYRLTLWQASPAMRPGILDRNLTNYAISSAGLQVNIITSVSASCDASGLTLYVNGKYSASSATAYGGNVTTYPIIMGANSAGASAIEGILFCYFLYNRRLTAQEHFSLHNNPYQLFLHPVWDAYFVPAAAPPPTGGKSIFGYDSIFHAGGIIQT